MSDKRTPYSCIDFRCGWIVRRKHIPDNTILVLQVTPTAIWFTDNVKWTDALLQDNAHLLEVSKDGGDTWFEPYHQQ